LLHDPGTGSRGTRSSYSGAPSCCVGSHTWSSSVPSLRRSCRSAAAAVLTFVGSRCRFRVCAAQYGDLVAQRQDLDVWAASERASSANQLGSGSLMFRSPAAKALVGNGDTLLSTTSGKAVRQPTSRSPSVSPAVIVRPVTELDNRRRAAWAGRTLIIQPFGAVETVERW
jgi:hypothetical protein